MTKKLSKQEKSFIKNELDAMGPGVPGKGKK